MGAAKPLLALAFIAAAVPAAAAQRSTPESRARWETLSHAVYGADASRLQPAGPHVAIDAPEVAQDSALVPVTIRIAPSVPAKTLDLIIDNNPSPVAAKIVYGPDGDSRQMTLRVRINAFTNMHAVVRAADGRMLESTAFVQGAGGCSAPMGTSAADVSAHMGEMRMHFGSDAALGDAPMATLMIHHPNFNGMQDDPATHAPIPARYVSSIAVFEGDTSVFTMKTDISLATNPVIEFPYKREAGKPFKVTVVDSTGAHWTQQFDQPPKGLRAER